MANPQLWLQQWQSNGVAVGAAELMYYRTKMAAFARHRKLHPPRSQSGAILSKTRGRGMEFDEVRHYQPGDDVRAIDWRVTARTGSPHTKLFREERERPVMIIVDLSHSLHFGSRLLFKSVTACHIAAAIAWQAVDRGDRIGALVGHPQRHFEVRPQARQRGVLRVIHTLVEMQQASLSDWQQQMASDTNVLNDLLQRAQQVAKPGTLIYCISDWLQADEETFKSLRLLQRHCSVTPILCSDPLEQSIPQRLQGQDLAMTDGEQALTFPAGDTREREYYQQLASQHHQRVIAELKALQFSVKEFSAARAVEEQWPEVMRIG